MLVRNQQLHGLDELVAVAVEQATVAAQAVVDQHFAALIAENRRTDRECFERQQRQALVRRRAHNNRCRFERLQPLLFGEQTGEVDVRFFGQRHQLVAHQDQRRVTAVGDVTAEIFDELFASLAGIDAAAVQREGSVDTMAALEARTARRYVRLIAIAAAS